MHADGRISEQISKYTGKLPDDLIVLKSVSLPTPRGEDPLWPEGRRKARE
jgi:hypothetical protein